MLKNEITSNLLNNFTLERMCVWYPFTTVLLHTHMDIFGCMYVCCFQRMQLSQVRSSFIYYKYKLFSLLIHDDALLLPCTRYSALYFDSLFLYFSFLCLHTYFTVIYAILVSVFQLFFLQMVFVVIKYFHRHQRLLFLFTHSHIRAQHIDDKLVYAIRQCDDIRLVNIAAKQQFVIQQLY